MSFLCVTGTGKIFLADVMMRVEEGGGVVEEESVSRNVDICKALRTQEL